MQNLLDFFRDSLLTIVWGDKRNAVTRCIEYTFNPEQQKPNTIKTYVSYEFCTIIIQLSQPDLYPIQQK